MNKVSKGVCSDAELKLLQDRNDARSAKAKEALGDTWLLHPANSPTKKVKK